MGVERIAEKLNKMGFSCPSEYKSTSNLKSTDSSKAWKPNTIRRMLSNYTYIGCVHQGKITTRNYKDRKTIYLKIDDHIIIENMHEAIVDKKLFNHVQQLIRSKIRTRTAEHKERVYIFSGYLRCKDCGNSLLRCPTRKNGKEYVYYRCRRYKQKKKGCTNSSPIKHELVYKSVLQSIMDHIRYCCNLQLQLNKVRKSIRQSASLTKLKNKIKQAQVYIASQKKLKCSAYEDWKADNITKDDFLTVKSEIDRRIQSQVNVIERSKHKVDYYTSFDSGKMDWLENIVQYKDTTDLNRKIVSALIHKIFIDQDQLVTVVFNNSNEIERLKEYINEIKGK